MKLKYFLILLTITFISNNLVYTMNVENNTEFENNYANNESMISTSKLKIIDKNLYKKSENNTFNKEHDSIQHKKQEYKDDGVIFGKNGNDNNNINESVIFGNNINESIIFDKNHNNLNKNSNDNNNINESIIFNKNNNNINKNSNDNNDINESVI